MPRGAFLFSAKPKPSSYFGWLFILNILLDINDGPGQAALYHQRMAGWGLSDQKSTARRDHAHRDRRGLFSIHTKYGLLNRLPTKVSFSIFD